MKYEITTFGNPVLRKKATVVETVTPEIQELVASLLETMYEAQGLGLAAEQIGSTEAVCVVDVPPDCESDEYVPLNAHVKMPLIMINPEISQPEGSLRRKEGCLSFPDIYMEVTRPKSCLVSYMGVDGQHYETRVYGLLARAVMHETDHLNGIVFIDKLSSAQKMICGSKLRRLESATKRALGARRD